MLPCHGDPFAPITMKRLVHTSVATIVSAWFGFATAQTAAPNPARPARTVESVRPIAEVLKDAARLDALLERGLQRHKETPLPIVDDATFLRRSYLSIVGRIPTLAETEQFLADQGDDKRARLCDRLLDAAGHTSHVTNFS